LGRRASGGASALFETLNYVTIDWLAHEQDYYRLSIDRLSAVQPRRFWLEVGRGCFFHCGMCGGGLRSHRDRPVTAHRAPA
jgi:radical SAM superfamily enzyme YgiQ (UPF0313 family)